MPDCSWCNEGNCPATEANVAKKKMWFFAKSKAELNREITKINEKCARICGECEREVQEKLDRSGTVKSTSWLGRDKTFHRELSDTEKTSLKGLRDRYSSLGYRSSTNGTDEFNELQWDDTPRGKVRYTNWFLMNQFEGNQKAQRNFEEFPQFIENPEALVSISKNTSELMDAILMTEAYLRGDNFVTFLACVMSAREGGSRFPRILHMTNFKEVSENEPDTLGEPIEGEDRLNALIQTGVLRKENNNPYDYTYTVDEKAFETQPWFPKLWEKVITANDPDYPPSLTGWIPPGKCNSLPIYNISR